MASTLEELKFFSKGDYGNWKKAQWSISESFCVHCIYNFNLLVELDSNINHILINNLQNIN